MTDEPSPSAVLLARIGKARTWEEIRRRLSSEGVKVTTAALRAWATGRSVPKLPAREALERLYQLPAAGWPPGRKLVRAWTPPSSAVPGRSEAIDPPDGSAGGVAAPASPRGKEEHGSLFREPWKHDDAPPEQSEGRRLLVAWLGPALAGLVSLEASLNAAPSVDHMQITDLVGLALGNWSPSAKLAEVFERAGLVWASEWSAPPADGPLPDWVEPPEEPT